jgi:hypothetical protein
MTSRIEAATEISSRINANKDYKARVWSKNGQVRVYLTADSGGKKGFVDAGEINVDFDGSIIVSDKTQYALRYDKAFLASITEGVAAAAEAKPEFVPVARTTNPVRDEDEVAFEQSQRAAYAAESMRELG